MARSFAYVISRFGRKAPSEGGADPDVLADDPAEETLLPPPSPVRTAIRTVARTLRQFRHPFVRRHVEPADLHYIRRLFGWRWPHCRDVVYEIAHTYFREALGPDAAIRLQRGKFFIHLPGQSARQAHRRVLRARRQLFELIANSEAVQAMHRHDEAPAGPAASVLPASSLPGSPLSPSVLPRPETAGRDTAIANALVSELERRAPVPPEAVGRPPDREAPAPRPSAGPVSAEPNLPAGETRDRRAPAPKAPAASTAAGAARGPAATASRPMPTPTRRRAVPEPVPSRDVPADTPTAARPAADLTDAFDRLTAASAAAADDGTRAPAPAPDPAAAAQPGPPAGAPAGTARSTVDPVPPAEPNSDAAPGAETAPDADPAPTTDIAAVEEKMRRRELRRLERGIAAAADRIDEYRNTDTPPPPAPAFPPTDARIVLRPVWIGRRAAMLSLHSYAVSSRMSGKEEILAEGHASESQHGQDLAALDMFFLDQLPPRLPEVLERFPCSMISLPIHHSTLHYPQYRKPVEDRLAAAAPEIGRALIFEIIGLQHLVKEETLARHVAALLKYGRSVVGRVPISWTRFAALQDVGLSAIGVDLSTDARSEDAIAVDAEIFSTLARRAKLTTYAVGLTPSLRTIFKDAGFNIFEGSEVDMSILLDGGEVDPAALDFVATLTGPSA